MSDDSDKYIDTDSDKNEGETIKSNKNKYQPPENVFGSSVNNTNNIIKPPKGIDPNMFYMMQMMQQQNQQMMIQMPMMMMQMAKMMKQQETNSSLTSESEIERRHKHHKTPVRSSLNQKTGSSLKINKKTRSVDHNISITTKEEWLESPDEYIDAAISSYKKNSAGYKEQYKQYLKVAKDPIIFNMRFTFYSAEINTAVYIDENTIETIYEYCLQHQVYLPFYLLMLFKSKVDFLAWRNSKQGDNIFNYIDTWVKNDKKYLDEYPKWDIGIFGVLPKLTIFGDNEAAIILEPNNDPKTDIILSKDRITNFVKQNPISLLTSSTNIDRPYAVMAQSINLDYFSDKPFMAGLSDLFTIASRKEVLTGYLKEFKFVIAPKKERFKRNLGLIRNIQGLINDLVTKKVVNYPFDPQCNTEDLRFDYFQNLSYERLRIMVDRNKQIDIANKLLLDSSKYKFDEEENRAFISGSWIPFKSRIQLIRVFFLKCFQDLKYPSYSILGKYILDAAKEYEIKSGITITPEQYNIVSQMFNSAPAYYEIVRKVPILELEAIESIESTEEKILKIAEEDTNIISYFDLSKLIKYSTNFFNISYKDGAISTITMYLNYISFEEEKATMSHVPIIKFITTESGIQKALDTMIALYNKNGKIPSTLKEYLTSVGSSPTEFQGKDSYLSPIITITSVILYESGGSSEILQKLFMFKENIQRINEAAKAQTTEASSLLISQNNSDILNYIPPEIKSLENNLYRVESIIHSKKVIGYKLITNRGSIITYSGSSTESRKENNCFFIALMHSTPNFERYWQNANPEIQIIDRLIDDGNGNIVNTKISQAIGERKGRVTLNKILVSLGETGYYPKFKGRSPQITSQLTVDEATMIAYHSARLFLRVIDINGEQINKETYNRLISNVGSNPEGYSIINDVGRYITIVLDSGHYFNYDPVDSEVFIRKTKGQANDIIKSNKPVTGHDVIINFKVYFDFETVYQPAVPDMRTEDLDNSISPYSCSYKIVFDNIDIKVNMSSSKPHFQLKALVENYKPLFELLSKEARTIFSPNPSTNKLLDVVFNEIKTILQATEHTGDIMRALAEIISDDICHTIRFNYTFIAFNGSKFDFIPLLKYMISSGYKPDDKCPIRMSGKLSSMNFFGLSQKVIDYIPEFYLLHDSTKVKERMDRIRLQKEAKLASEDITLNDEKINEDINEIAKNNILELDKERKILLGKSLQAKSKEINFSYNVWDPRCFVVGSLDSAAYDFKCELKKGSLNHNEIQNEYSKSYIESLNEKSNHTELSLTSWKSYLERRKEEIIEYNNRDVDVLHELVEKIINCGILQNNISTRNLFFSSPTLPNFTYKFLQKSFIIPEKLLNNIIFHLTVATVDDTEKSMIVNFNKITNPYMIEHMSTSMTNFDLLYSEYSEDLIDLSNGIISDRIRNLCKNNSIELPSSYRDKVKPLKNKWDDLIRSGNVAGRSSTNIIGGRIGKIYIEYKELLKRRSEHMIKNGVIPECKITPNLSIKFEDIFIESELKEDQKKELERFLFEGETSNKNEVFVGIDVKSEYPYVAAERLYPVGDARELSYLELENIFNSYFPSPIGSNDKTKLYVIYVEIDQSELMKRYPNAGAYYPYRVKKETSLEEKIKFETIEATEASEVGRLKWHFDINTKIKAWIPTPTLVDLLSHGGKVTYLNMNTGNPIKDRNEIIGIMWDDSAYIFTSYMHLFMKAKIEEDIKPKNSRNEAKRLMAKLAINGPLGYNAKRKYKHTNILYTDRGKLRTHINKLATKGLLPLNNTEGLERISSENWPEGTILDNVDAGFVKLPKFYNPEANAPVPSHISMFIYAYARSYMWNVVFTKCKSYNYTDTDSAFPEIEFLKTLKENNLLIEENNVRMGKFENEGIFDQLTVISAKFYYMHSLASKAFKDKIAMKGISLRDTYVIEAPETPETSENLFKSINMMSLLDRKEQFTLVKNGTSVGDVPKYMFDELLAGKEVKTKTFQFQKDLKSSQIKYKEIIKVTNPITLTTEDLDASEDLDTSEDDEDDEEF